MSMPNHLVLVRHGESEGNLVRSEFKHGITTHLTPEFRARPAHEWRLTPAGVKQAQEAGRQIEDRVLKRWGLTGFSRYLYSPHRRTRETAAQLGLHGARWRLNRLLREREWGELAETIGPDHRDRYPANHAWMEADPLNWAPPGGESIVQVADNRVRELFDSLHRDHDEKEVDSVIAVTHGEFIWATKLVLDYMSNETYSAADADPELKIQNCHVVHWTRLDPDTHAPAPYLKWSRSLWPQETPWQAAGRTTLTNEQLRSQAEELKRLW